MPKLRFTLILLIAAYQGLTATASEPDAHTLYKHAETWYWLGIMDKGDPAAFRVSLQYLGKASEAAAWLDPKEQHALHNKIEMLQLDLQEQIPIASDNFIGTFPLARFMGHAPFADVKAWGSYEIFEDPAEVATERAAEKLVNLFDDRFFGELQIPLVVLSENQAFPELESKARVTLKNASRIKIYQIPYLMRFLDEAEIASLQQKNPPVELLQRLCNYLNVERIAIFTIRQMDQVDNIHYYQFRTLLFSGSNPNPTESIILEQIIRDNRITLWHYAGVFALLFLLSIAFYTRHTYTHTASYPALLQIVTEPVMAFFTGFLTSLIALNLLAATMPDYQDYFGYTFWWIPAIFLLLLFVPLFIIRNFILRFSFYQGYGDTSHKLGALFTAAALGISAYLSLGMMLYHASEAWSYVSAGALSLSIIAYINGKTLSSIKPLPFRFAVLSVLLLPITGLVLAASEPLYLKLPLMALAVLWVAGKARIRRRQQKQISHDKPQEIDAVQLQWISEDPPYKVPAQFVAVYKNAEPFLKGETVVLHLSADGGTGKTATANHLICQLHKEKFPANKPLMVLEAQCSESYNTPYQPLQDALYDIMNLGDTSESQDHIQEIDNLLDNVFWNYVPFAGMVAPEPRERHTSFGSQTELFYNFFNTLRKLSQQNALVLFIDDLHWADAATLELLSFLQNKCSNTPDCHILFLYTARKSENMQEFSQSSIALAPLSFKERMELLCQQLGFEEHSAQTILQYIHDQKQRAGDLFWLYKIIELLARQELIKSSSKGFVLDKEILNSGRLPVPEEYRLAVREELTKLKEREKFIAMAACLGMEFEVSVLSEALGIDKLMCLETLRQLEKDTSFICDIVEKDDVYGFTSSFTLETIRQELSLSQEGPKGKVMQIVREYHARIARVLEKDPTGGNVMRIAHHYYAAGKIYSHDALRFLLPAADHCAEIYRFGEAREFLRKASEAASFCSTSPNWKLDALLIECKISWLEGTQAQPLAERCAAWLEKHPNTTPKVRIVFARTHYYARQFKQAVQICKDILALSPEPRELAKTHHLLGISLEKEQFDERINHLKKAEEIAIGLDTGDPSIARMLGAIYNSLGEIFSAKAEDEKQYRKKAYDCYQQSIRIKEKSLVNDTPGLARSYGGLGRLELFVKPVNAQAALEWFEKDLVLSEKIGDLKGQTQMHSLMGSCYLKLNEPTLALEQFRTSLSLTSDLSDQAFALKGLLEIYDLQPQADWGPQVLNDLCSILQNLEFKPDRYLINNLQTYLEECKNPQLFAPLQPLIKT